MLQIVQGSTLCAHVMLTQVRKNASHATDATGGTLAHHLRRCYASKVATVLLPII